ncbi:MAG: hypothetical protein N2037_08495 [Acidimicrobiales bacterium]|nr:hypothetical protein [Acidimicrobiales bacterium]
MNAPRLDLDVVARRLRLLRDPLDQLGLVRGVRPAGLEEAPIERVAVFVANRPV